MILCKRLEERRFAGPDVALDDDRVGANSFRFRIRLRSDRPDQVLICFQNAVPVVRSHAELFRIKSWNLFRLERMAESVAKFSHRHDCHQSNRLSLRNFTTKHNCVDLRARLFLREKN